MSQAFISYSKADKSDAADFKIRIEKAGFHVWMDTKLHAGREWREEIDEEIRKSIAVVVIMTASFDEAATSRT